MERLRKVVFLLSFLLYSCGGPLAMPVQGEPEIVPWDRGIIPYVIHEDFSDLCVNQIEDAMADWEQTGIDFIEAEGHWSYVNVLLHEKKNSSYVGKIGGTQELHLTKDCTYDTVLHELGHAIGLEHEHQRYDRDKYVEIHWKNIEKKEWDNFLKSPRSEHGLATPYDFESVMHYSSYAFSKNNKRTITRKDSERTIWGGWVISDYDIEKVEVLYEKEIPK